MPPSKIQKKKVWINTDDGISLAAEIGKPNTGQFRGVVLFVHGFGGNKYENGLFTLLMEHCVSAGYRTLVYDWRGIGDSEGEFHSSVIKQHALDFNRVVRWASSNLGGPDKPIHAVGFSLGAALVGLTLPINTDLSRIVYLSPAVRPRISMWPRYSYENKKLWRSIERKGLVQKPGSKVLLGKKILESLRETDLGDRAFDIDVPLLVCHGAEDTCISCSHSQSLVRNRKANSEFKYREFEGASHSFRPDRSNWPKIASEISDWIDGPSKKIKRPNKSSAGFKLFSNFGRQRFLRTND